jgi:hypothetical protein
MSVSEQRRQLNQINRALSIELNSSTEPASSRGTHYHLAIRSNNLSVVINPLPLLSAVQTLALIFYFPFQPISIVNGDKGEPPKMTGNNDAMAKFTAEINVQCCSAIFLIDRTKLRGGVLHFNVSDLSIEFKACFDGANLTLSAEPFELLVGQHQETCSGESWVVMPLKPIMLIEGTRLLKSIREENRKTKHNSHRRSWQIYSECRAFNDMFFAWILPVLESFS